MKLMLVGYLENLNSDRRIISNSRMRMDILFFLGYDLDEELPWHSTLSRTRQLYGEEQFTSIFKHILKQCVDKGLVSGKRQAVDSVFVKANASMASMIEREVLLDASVYAKELDANQQDETTVPVVSLKQTGHCDKKTKDKSAKHSNKTHMSPSDPDSRMSVKPGKTTKLNYLGQVSVDTENHVITHIQGFHADKGDAYCFPEIVSHTDNNLKETGLEIQEILADTGYSSQATLQALIDRGITGYIPNQSGYKFNREGFIYDRENDRYSCTEGKFLTFRHFQTDSNNTYKVYKTGIKDCRECSFKSTCANSVGVKSLADVICKELHDQMYLRMKTDKGKRMRRLRSSTVEPVIGTLVNFTAMSKVYTKGIKIANKCMIMAAVAYNLKKLIKVNTLKFKEIKATAIRYSKDKISYFLLNVEIHLLTLSVEMFLKTYYIVKEKG